MSSDTKKADIWHFGRYHRQKCNFCRTSLLAETETFYFGRTLVFAPPLRIVFLVHLSSLPPFRCCPWPPFCLCSSGHKEGQSGQLIERVTCRTQVRQKGCEMRFSSLLRYRSRQRPIVFLQPLCLTCCVRGARASVVGVCWHTFRVNEAQASLTPFHWCLHWWCKVAVDIATSSMSSACCFAPSL